MSELTSTCCGAKIEWESPIREESVYMRAFCSKCHKLTEIKEKSASNAVESGK